MFEAGAFCIGLAESMRLGIPACGESIAELRRIGDMLASNADRVEWQPIETAPKDWTRVLIDWGDESEVDIRRWSTENSRWEDDDDWGYESLEPARWMPLPLPRKADGT